MKTIVIALTAIAMLASAAAPGVALAKKHHDSLRYDASQGVERHKKH